MTTKTPTHTRLTFAKNLRKYRLSNNYTQEQLAEKSGLHPNYVGSVERGERNISIDNMQKLAGALHMDLRELLSEVEE